MYSVTAYFHVSFRTTTAVSQGKPVSILIITCDWSAITPGTFSYGTEFRCPLEDLNKCK